jgi:FkbM family methyltransferase
MKRQEFEYLIHRKLLSFGWRVQRDKPAPDGWLPGCAYWDPAYLRRLDFQPATLIDIGVGRGTQSLYRAFPEAYLVLIEPLSEFAADTAAILASRPGVHVPVALGSEPGRREIRVEPRQLMLTSFYERHRLERTGESPEIRQIEVETLDRVIAACDCPRPFGVKIDTEGAELEILRGATSVLRETEFLIAEVSVLRRFQSSYSFAALIAELDSLGFETCDILDIGRADSSHVTFFDLVFQRKPA